jgi:hypothetical protein
VGVWHYIHKTHKDSHKTWGCVSALRLRLIRLIKEDLKQNSPQASPILFE